MVDINFKELRAAIVNLNQSGLIKKKLSLVGVAKEKIYEDFMVVMDKMENDPETNEFPAGAEEALDYFNKMVDLEKKAEENKVKKDVKKEIASKSEKPKKQTEEKTKKNQPVVKKEKKNQVTVNKYGHRESSQAAQIDIAFEKGGTFKEIAEELKLSVGRIRGHYHHMISNKGVIFVEKNNSYKIKKS